MSDTVTLTIDGRQISVPAGTTILDAAAELGIDIPVICYHPHLTAMAFAGSVPSTAAGVCSQPPA